MPTTLGTLDAAKLKLLLSEKVQESKERLQRRHPAAFEFIRKTGIEPGKIREHAARVAATGALAGTMLLSGPIGKQVGQSPLAVVASMNKAELEHTLKGELKKILPSTVGPLPTSQENTISDEIKKIWGIRATAVLNNEKLNQSYGYIGAEQHLPRFPGDSVDQHDAYLASGITPGLGAWGYFANSKEALTGDLAQKEKYYVAVQTLYLPDWEKRLPYLREWYKYRKVLVVNPQNGKTIVAVVGDAGPADWTGKHYGGSPEIMAYLGLNVGMQKGAVILFFVDDPENEIPLGPVEYNVINGPSKVAQKI